MRRAPSERVRRDLHARLSERREEIEAAILTRVLAVSGSAEDLDSDYAEGLRAAVSAALGHALAAIELGEERCPPPPGALLAQARLAARSGVSLDTVFRRYFAGQALITDCLVEEAEREGASGASVQRLLRAQAAVFDRLLEALGAEHAREAQRRLSSTTERRTERIERLLAGEQADTTELAYDFDAHHLGLIAGGAGAAQAIRDLASEFGSRLLALERAEGVVWAWLGGRVPLNPQELRGYLAQGKTPLRIALGEPALGLGGWRLSHRQAKAALPIALRGAESIVRYADVALLAAILRDDLLASSMRQLYLAPLEAERDGGEVARETLRAYFATGRNLSSAAALLGVSRQTIANRLRAIEGRLGGPLAARAAELEVALRLDELEQGKPSPDCTV